MAVDDAELLALAGGESSDEETPQAPTFTAKAASPMPAAGVSQTIKKSVSPSMNNLTPNASTKRGSGHKVTKKTRKDDSEEEGEASSTPASPKSLSSAAMSESASDSSPANDEGNIFPVDNKFYSAKDKKEIMSLSEVQRESILAERAQILERNLQDQHLRKLLQAREKTELKSADKKRKAGNADLEDSPRKSSRQKKDLGGRKVGETSGAIEAYKRQREEKNLRDQQRRREGANRRDRKARSSSGNRYSSADAEGESEVEWDDGKLKVDDYKNRSSQPADYNDVRRVTLPRNLFSKICFYPGFSEAVKDCYVRLPAKPKPNGEASYELFLVKGIIEKEGWDYAVEKADGKKFITNQHALLAMDGGVKEQHFNSLSNSVVTEAEVANYENLMTDQGKPLPTKPFLVGKIDDINAVVNHSFTEEELQEKLRRSGALRTRFAPLDRTGIINRRRAAEERGDEAAVAKCDAELSTLNGPKLKYGTFLVNPKAQPTAPAELTQQERLAELNRINRKKNSEDVRKAQLAERKAARIAREAVERGEALQNPFARVKTYAKTHHDVNETLAPHRARQNANSRDISRAGTPAAASTPKLEPEKKQDFPSPRQKFTASGMPMIGNRNMDDEIIAAMDLGIDIEI